MQNDKELQDGPVKTLKNDKELQDSPVKTLKNDKELQEKLERANKVVVLEFMKQDNQVYKFKKQEVDRIAKAMSGKADFYELDVKSFKKYAEKFNVEALPAFVLMERFCKKRHLVGTDGLKQAIEEVYSTIKAQGRDESGQDGPKADSEQQGKAGSKDEPEQEGNKGSLTDSGQQGNTAPENKSTDCSIL